MCEKGGRISVFSFHSTFSQKENRSTPESFRFTTQKQNKTRDKTKTTVRSILDTGRVVNKLDAESPGIPLAMHGPWHRIGGDPPNQHAADPASVAPWWEKRREREPASGAAARTSESPSVPTTVTTDGPGRQVRNEPLPEAPRGALAGATATGGGRHGEQPQRAVIATANNRNGDRQQKHPSLVTMREDGNRGLERAKTQGGNSTSFRGRYRKPTLAAPKQESRGAPSARHRHNAFLPTFEKASTIKRLSLIFLNYVYSQPQ